MSEINRRQFLGFVGAAAASTTLAKVGWAQDGDDKYGRAIKAEASLKAYWRLDGDMLDAKGRNNVGVRKGSVGYETGPLGRKAATLDGNTVVATTASGALDFDSTTVEFFFKIANAPTSDYNPCLIAQRASSQDTRFSVHVQSDLKQLMVWNGGSLAVFAPIDGPFRVGEWYHVAIVSGPATMTGYVNGAECEIVIPAPFNRGKKNLPVVFGASDPEGSEICACSLAEVAIYDSALSAKALAGHIEAAGLAAVARKLNAQRKKAAGERAAARKAKTDARLKDHRLFARGSQRVYEGEHLEAIEFAVGGIGTGPIFMNGKAERTVWQIFNNFDSLQLPNSFFAVRAGGVTRALQTASVGPFTKMDSLKFRGEYPFAWYDFADAKLPVKVSLECYSPFIPLNAKDSAIPCAVYNFALENPTDKTVEVQLLAAQQNAVGYAGGEPILGRKCKHYGGNRNHVAIAGGYAALHMQTDASPESPGYGDMVLATTVPDATGTASWTSLPNLFESFGAGDFTAGPSPAGETVDGALSAKLTLKPKEKRTATFVLTWHFPNARHGGVDGWTYSGNMYANHWGSALEVAEYVGANAERLSGDTALFHKTAYDGNLPRWYLDRVTSQLAVLRSKTCFWAKDGYFGAWEGCNQGGGCCHGSCTHVWHYAQSHARLFPELGRIMRETTYGFQKPDGSLPHRHPNYDPATDGQLGDILGVYREHLCSADGAWLRKMWPKARKAMDSTIERWDKDENGVLAGAQWNTLDGALGGSTSWIGTLYLAALAACEKMATLQGDRAAAARYRKIREAGAKLQNETLWNGEYYMQIPDPQPRHDYDDGCAIDQLLGEWWSNQLGLQPHYPVDRIRKALGALVKYNFQPDFHGVPQAPRRFVADDDPGMQMIKWPHGPRPVPTIAYGDEVMSGFEYSAAACMVQFGMLREGFMVLLAASDRYDGKIRRGMTYGWDWTGNPFGDDECGKYYARPMSVWSMLLAAQGFVYDGPAGVIGFKPVWKPEDHKSFWSGSEGWGSFIQKRTGSTQKETVEVAWGSLRVRRFEFALPEGGKAFSVKAKAAGKSVGARIVGTAAVFDEPIILAAGQKLEIGIACQSLELPSASHRA